ncbi:hypothetical protein GCM10018771_71850 [Streptomyces cellulosae]|nr:hypothetical protein GCM10018771_71850 [Streptomyces cellulosae]
MSRLKDAVQTVGQDSFEVLDEDQGQVAGRLVRNQLCPSHRPQAGSLEWWPNAPADNRTQTEPAWNNRSGGHGTGSPTRGYAKRAV